MLSTLVMLIRIFPALRDLAQAERWYQQSLELHDERDRLGRGRCLFQLGATGFTVR